MNQLSTKRSTVKGRFENVVNFLRFGMDTEWALNNITFEPTELTGEHQINGEDSSYVVAITDAPQLTQEQSTEVVQCLLAGVDDMCDIEVGEGLEEFNLSPGENIYELHGIDVVWRNEDGQEVKPDHKTGWKLFGLTCWRG